MAVAEAKLIVALAEVEAAPDRQPNFTNSRRSSRERRYPSAACNAAAPETGRRGLAARRAAVRRVAEFLGPYRRTRPRDADTAALLRQAGTPDALIGPVDDTSGADA